MNGPHHATGVKANPHLGGFRVTSFLDIQWPHVKGGASLTLRLGSGGGGGGICALPSK